MGPACYGRLLRLQLTGRMIRGRIKLIVMNGGTLNAIEAAERGGVDLSLIDESLGYSYEERAVHHQRALNMALEFERAGRELGFRKRSSECDRS